MSDDSDSEQSPMSLLRLPSRDLALVKKLPSLGTAAAGHTSPMVRELCINKREPQATQPAAQMLIAHLLTKENAMYKIERDIYAARRMRKLFGKK